MRPSALFPMACAIAAFVLGMLCLFAGHKPGFMEDYDILTLNTSSLGQNLIPTPTSGGSSTATATSIGSFFSSLVHNATDTIEGDIENELNDIAGDVANKLASTLGIHEFYSLHLMDLCEGQYKPNATEKGAKKNVTSCTNATAMYHFDISKTIQQELDKGPLKNVSLSELHWPDDIQKGLNDLNAAMDATFVLYVIGIAAAGLAIITALIAVFLNGSRLTAFGNWGLTSLSFLAFLISSIIVTVVQKKAVNLINKYGLGVHAYKGGKYLTITWVAVALMFLATAAWVVEFCVGRKKKPEKAQ